MEAFESHTSVLLRYSEQHDPAYKKFLELNLKFFSKLAIDEFLLQLLTLSLIAGMFFQSFVFMKHFKQLFLNFLL